MGRPLRDQAGLRNLPARVTGAMVSLHSRRGFGQYGREHDRLVFTSYRTPRLSMENGVRWAEGRGEATWGEEMWQLVQTSALSLDRIACSRSLASTSCHRRRPSLSKERYGQTEVNDRTNNEGKHGQGVNGPASWSRKELSWRETTDRAGQ